MKKQLCDFGDVLLGTSFLLTLPIWAPIVFLYYVGVCFYDVVYIELRNLGREMRGKRVER